MKTAYKTSVYSVFAAYAKQWPDRAALVFPDGTAVEYGHLHRCAEKLAAHLIEMGVSREDVIGLFHRKAVEGYIAMLACLRIGAAYVNLDEDNPPTRMRLVLEKCSPHIILADGSVRPAAVDTCAAANISVLMVEQVLARPSAGVSLSTHEEVIGTDIAYLMFTSGSTGTPKGVAISHAQVLNFAAWARDEFSVREDDVFTNVNPMYFDNSVFDFYASLLNGASLAPLPPSLLRDPHALVDHVARSGCTIWFSVPSLLIYLVTTRALSAKVLPLLRNIVFGGEGYPIPELRKLHGCFGDRVRLVNVYGPTECTCICSAHDITPAHLEASAGLPPIGSLAPNFRGLLLDGDEPVSPGEAGELCLIGPNVGLGYFNDPERTVAAFVPNPLCRTHREMMYRTGDLMRVDTSNGLIHFVGRKDNQIKHMGYRIELEEIEAALGSVPGVEQCAVIYKRIRTQFGHLIAFVSTADETLEPDAIGDCLRSKLPEYMIPNRIHVRNELPKNANGKIDRQRLSEEA